MRDRGRAGAGWAAALCLVGATGCTNESVVQSDLPIKHVVVYRNGVAYFERAGHVDESQVSFKMRQAEVGDFLATLAVMEKGGSSVRSAAFPLKTDDDATPKDAKPEDAQRAMRTVVLDLDGKVHDLDVGYVAASPVWRPSYRLIVQPNGQADLQAWGIVQNLSGEDWTNIKLSLVAGAPLAFEAQLGTPVIPDRPIVTDQGEVITAMPKAETSLRTEDRDADGIPDKKDAEDEDKAPADTPKGQAQAAPGAPAPAAPPAPPASKAETSASTRGVVGGEGYRKRRLALDEDTRGPSAPKNLRSLAAVAVQGGTTRYDIPTAITVPDKSATMVMLLSRKVPGETAFLFAPDDGVPDSVSHPFRVARFANGTPGVLERGPIAVFKEGSFVGQGLLEPLATGASATVPFALDRSIGDRQAREVRHPRVTCRQDRHGVLWLEHDLVIKTFYDLQNGGDEAAKILVRHPRANGTRLNEPPPGTEDNVGTGSALVPALVAAHGKQELVIDERSTTSEPADWFSLAAENAVKAYLADPRANQDVVHKLTPAWPLHDQIRGKQEQEAKVRLELSQLASEAAEKRADLHAIEKNKTADALRKSLTARLTLIAARQDVLTAENIQLGQDVSELQIRWREAIRNIKLTTPTKEAGGK